MMIIHTLHTGRNMAMPKRNQNHLTVVTTDTAPMYPAVIISTVCVCALYIKQCMSYV
jgi:hypothetical protein